MMLEFLVLAHLPDRPDLDKWASELHNKRGEVCCDFSESHGVADADWETKVVDGTSHYRVKYKGEWLVVDDESVIEAPNLYSAPLVWFDTVNGSLHVKCFLKGVEG